MSFNVFDQKQAIKPKVWTREMAIALAESMEPFIKPLGYQVLLGGSVLTKGKSGKNLNLYFMPTFDGGGAQDMQLVTWLASILGQAQGFQTRATVTGKPDNGPTYKHYINFVYDGLPISVSVGR